MISHSSHIQLLCYTVLLIHFKLRSIKPQRPNYVIDLDNYAQHWSISRRYNEIVSIFHKQQTAKSLLLHWYEMLILMFGWRSQNKHFGVCCLQASFEYYLVHQYSLVSSAATASKSPGKADTYVAKLTRWKRRVLFTIHTIRDAWTICFYCACVAQTMNQFATNSIFDRFQAVAVDFRIGYWSLSEKIQIYSMFLTSNCKAMQEGVGLKVLCL